MLWFGEESVTVQGKKQGHADNDWTRHLSLLGKKWWHAGYRRQRKRWEEQWIVLAKGGWSWGPNGSKWKTRSSCQKAGWVKLKCCRGWGIGDGPCGSLHGWQGWITGSLEERSSRNWEARVLEESSMWVLKSLRLKHSFRLMTVSHSSKVREHDPRGPKMAV